MYKEVQRKFCGAEGTRTPDFRLAKAALYQLSYGPSANHCSNGLSNKTRNLHTTACQEPEEDSVIKGRFGPHDP